MPEETRRCTSCVLPDTDHFALDAGGTCSLCRTAASAPPAPREPARLAAELEERVRQIRKAGEGRPFDCVVGLSGGRDSTYLLYRLARVHGLRCLAAYYRTPFTSSVTDANVRRTVAALGVSLAEIALSPEEHRRFAREMVLLWLRKPDGIIGNMMCAPCKLVIREIFATARARGVRTVVCGANTYEAVQIAAGIAEDAAVATRAQLTLRSQLARSAALVRKGSAALIRHRELLRHLRLGVQASVMYVNPHTPYLRLRYPEISAVEYFYYHPWKQEDCERALAALGWELPPGCKSTWKTDCAFAEVKNHAFKRMTGVSYVDAFLSNMVRAGALGREEALRRLSVEGVPSEERLRAVCEVLELPKDTFGPSRPT